MWPWLRSVWSKLRSVLTSKKKPISLPPPLPPPPEELPDAEAAAKAEVVRNRWSQVQILPGALAFHLLAPVGFRVLLASDIRH